MIARMRAGGGVLAMPFLVAAAALVLLPALATVVLAFTRYDALSAPEFTGLDNVRRMAGDPIFRTALFNSLLFALVAVPLRIAIALGVALLYARPRRAAGMLRGAAYLPTVVPDIAFALLWLWILNPVYGPLGIALQAAGLPGGGLFLTTWGARAGIVLISLFQIGEMFIVALAARRELPAELYELALVDGASPWWTFRRITLPLMAPTLVLLAARDVTWSLQATFVPALVVTNGGPRFATTFLPLYTYENGFEFLRFGYASAMTVTMFVVTAAMVGVQLLALRRWREAWA